VQPTEGEITRLRAEQTVQKASEQMARPVQPPSCHAPNGRGKTPRDQITRLDYFVAVGEGRVIAEPGVRPLSPLLTAA